MASYSISITGDSNDSKLVLSSDNGHIHEDGHPHDHDHVHPHEHEALKTRVNSLEDKDKVLENSIQSNSGAIQSNSTAIAANSARLDVHEGLVLNNISNIQKLNSEVLLSRSNKFNWIRDGGENDYPLNVELLNSTQIKISQNADTSFGIQWNEDSNALKVWTNLERLRQGFVLDKIEVTYDVAKKYGKGPKSSIEGPVGPDGETKTGENGLFDVARVFKHTLDTPEPYVYELNDASGNAVQYNATINHILLVNYWEGSLLSSKVILEFNDPSNSLWKFRGNDEAPDVSGVYLHSPGFVSEPALNVQVFPPVLFMSPGLTDIFSLPFMGEITPDKNQLVLFGNTPIIFNKIPTNVPLYRQGVEIGIGERERHPIYKLEHRWHYAYGGKEKSQTFNYWFTNRQVFIQLASPETLKGSITWMSGTDYDLNSSPTTLDFNIACALNGIFPICPTENKDLMIQKLVDNSGNPDPSNNLKYSSIVAFLIDDYQTYCGIAGKGLLNSAADKKGDILGNNKFNPFNYNEIDRFEKLFYSLPGSVANYGDVMPKSEWDKRLCDLVSIVKSVTPLNDGSGLSEAVIQMYNASPNAAGGVFYNLGNLKLGRRSGPYNNSEQFVTNLYNLGQGGMYIHNNGTWDAEDPSLNVDDFKIYVKGNDLLGLGPNKEPRATPYITEFKNDISNILWPSQGESEVGLWVPKYNVNLDVTLENALSPDKFDPSNAYLNDLNGMKVSPLKVENGVLTNTPYDGTLLFGRTFHEVWLQVGQTSKNAFLFVFPPLAGNEGVEFKMKLDTSAIPANEELLINVDVAFDPINQVLGEDGRITEKIPDLIVTPAQLANFGTPSNNWGNINSTA